MRDYLLYIPTPDGTHKADIAGSRDFDVHLNVWGEKLNFPTCDTCSFAVGNMWPTIPHVIGKFDRQYKAYCFMCDDVEIDTPTLNAVFSAGLRDGLELWQPSLAEDSIYGWQHTKTRNIEGLRATNFVESMMPFFSVKGLKKCQWTFELTQSGWGIEFIWSLIVGEEKMGIYDNYTATLRREQTTHKRIFSSGMNGEQEMRVLLDTLNRRIKSLEQTY